jgi:outer membrane protein TolC
MFMFRRVGIFLLISASFLSLSFVPQVEAERGLPIVRIGIVSDGPPQSHSWGKIFSSQVFPKEILSLTQEDFDVRFPKSKIVHGKWSGKGVKRAVDFLLSDPSVDLVLGLGVIASQELASRKNLPKPVIAPFVFDRTLQGLPLRKGASGVRNLNYLSSLKSFERDVQAFKDIIPFTRLGLFIDQVVMEVFPLLHKKAARVGKRLGIEITIVPVGTYAESALAALPPGTEAVFVTPLLRLPLSEFQAVVDGLIGRKLPSFSLFGREDVERGIYASMAPETDTQRLARRVAVNIHRILLGENAGNLSVAFSTGERLTINMATARAVGKFPTFRVLTEADLINEEIEKVERRISLYSVIREAENANLDLAAADRGVAAGIGQVNNSRSALLPQVNVGTNALTIWQRTNRVDGGKPQNLGQVSGEIKQKVFSDKAWTAYTVEQNSQRARIQDRQQLRLDVVQAAAISYLDILRTKTVERIQKDNLKLTRTNLELARVRVTVGQSARDEVFRWENELANGRIAVLDAQAQARQARVVLNRILHRPLEEEFLTQETGLHDPLLSVSQKKLFAYLNNPKSFKVFRDFQVQEGLNVSPELKSLRALIVAQQRTALNAERAFWLPDVDLSASVQQRFYEDGPDIDQGSATLGTQLAETKTTVFSNMSLSFPLFAGGSKDATQIKAREDLRKLRLDWEATKGRVEERIRSSLFLAGASFPSIRLSREAAEAARKNYQLVLDQYSRGAVDIIKLVDTQTNYLNANLAAANAVYDFLIDMVNIQRSIGKFDYFQYTEDRESWFNRLNAFFAEAGVTPSQITQINPY